MRYTFFDIWTDIWLLKRTSLWPILLLSGWLPIVALLLRAGFVLTSDRGSDVAEPVLIGVIVIPVAWMLLVVGRMAEGRVDKEAVRRWLCNELEQRDENRSG